MTRPQPAADATAGRLAAAGFRPLLLPLTEIAPLAHEAASFPDCDAVAITSANAIRHAGREFLRMLADRPLHAVGERSADAARQAGFRKVLAGKAGNADALAAHILAQPKRPRNVLYLAGRPRTGRLEAVLEAAGIGVDVVEVYAAEPIPYERVVFETMLLQQGALSVLIYSAHAARVLVQQAKAHGVVISGSDIRFCAISDAAAAPLEALNGSVVVAKSPDEDALFDLLHDQTMRR